MSDAWEITFSDEILRVERWLERHTNPDAPMRTRYRSPELLDEDVSRGFENKSSRFFDAWQKDQPGDCWQERQELVAGVCKRRASILTHDDMNHIESDSTLPPGRLLAYDPDGSLSDGASTLATDEFFDGDNVPPWDLWLACKVGADDTQRWTPFQRYLICWIPDALVEMVDFGIQVNPEECFLWLDDVLKA